MATVLQRPAVSSVSITWSEDPLSSPDYLERTAEDHFGDGWSHVGDEDKARVIEEHGSIWKACARYAQEDAERLSDFRAGRWCFQSCVAVAEVRYEISPSTLRIEHLSSPGLSGIESDSDGAYLREVEVEQLVELSHHLERFGVAGTLLEELDALVSRKIPQVEGWAYIDVP